MTIALYDLAGRDAAVRFGPFCWRTRLCLLGRKLPTMTPLLPFLIPSPGAGTRPGRRCLGG
jgi:hypothetical protein